NELLGGAVPGIDVTTRSHEILFEAVEHWRALEPSIEEHLQIVFVGAGGNAVPREAPLPAFTRFTGYLPRHEGLRLVRAADLVFLPMHNLPAGQRSTSSPSKIYEYMASGRPILAAVPDGDARDFLARSGTALI